MSVEIPILTDVVMIFGLSSAVIIASHRFRIPPVIGFLLTGVLAGPYGLGLVGAVDEVEIFAEIGVILLLFVIGMELSLAELQRLKKPVFVGGAAQVLLTIAVLELPFMIYGVGLGKAIFIGFLAALSSTAIVLKLLGEKAQLGAPHGRISLGMLIFQDVAVVPMMLLIPLLAGTADNPWQSLGELLLKAVLVGAVLLVAARKVIPRVLEAAIRTRSRELFLMTTLGLCFAIALLTSSVGLSLSLGAFLAGLIMSESEYSHSALEGVLPFRDVFTSIFFVSIGMLLDPAFVLTHLPQVLGLAGAVLVLKAFLAALAGRLLGYPWHVAILGGLCLCQIGEFSFVLAGVGMGNKLLSPLEYQYFLAVAILTMAVTPFLIAAVPAISTRLVKLMPPGLKAEPPKAEQEDLHDHLIIAGFGLGGHHLARAAKAAGINYVILEMNPDTVRRERDRGVPIMYGDASQAAVLEHINVTKARILAVVISDPAAIGRIVATARAQNPALHIVVRTRFVSEIEPLMQLGAQEVVAEEYETSVEMFIRVLSTYLVPRGDIERFVREIRAEGYGMLRRPVLNTADACNLGGVCSSFGATVLRVVPGAFVEGKSLIEARLRKEHGLTVVAVQRDGRTSLNPDPEWVFEAGDRVHVFGEQDLISEKAALFIGAEGDTWN
ncbi:CPA2 family monovalent cation:H+ antiporter-2 [Desulfomicrobium macestii]|uniref:CPA2 family monovalent cation:H+ antiporter-2 n=1 Tax=Desulfomicrobium macestii TaxID=90731 RepID=A0ABR9H8D0_9BACT|nr:monovalent cation:proton antiporter family protein [Desulfomicrobium macestii]MBE1426979.1 CPA2 family monovalent cation:H+ antiporter-2 [Desulfomicrobium macestii]